MGTIKVVARRKCHREARPKPPSKRGVKRAHPSPSSFQSDNKTMGADLITYIGVGPGTIEADASDTETIIQEVKALQDRVEGHADRLIVEGETDLEDAPLPQNGADQSVSIPLDLGGDSERLEEISSQEKIEASENPTRLRKRALTFSGLGNFSVVLGADREAIEETITEFVETWNGEIPWRNVAYRSLPGDQERKVVVAGERSMGDEPGGAYQVMKKAYAMGIAQYFGCQ